MPFATPGPSTLTVRLAIAIALAGAAACTPATRTIPASDRMEARDVTRNGAHTAHVGNAAQPADTGPSQHATGRRVVETVCATCHSLQPPPKTAPPLAMVAMHYRRRSASDAEAIDRMVDWVRAPDPAKSLLPPMVIRGFGLMPPQPLRDSLLRAAAAYVMTLQHAMPMRHGMAGAMTSRARRGPP